MTRFVLFVLCLSLLASCSTDEQKKEDNTEVISNEQLQKEVQEFLDEYTKTYQELYYNSSEAEWVLNTHIVEGDTVASNAAEKANKAFAVFTGSKENIDKLNNYLYKQDMLTDLQVRQLKAMLYQAGATPEIAGSIIDQKIKADAEQTKLLFGFNYSIDGKTASTNDIDKILKESSNIEERLKAWRASKEVGKPLKKGLENLRFLRNESVQALGYKDYFAYQVSDYGMTTEEMRELCNQMVKDIWPLYRELHTWARYTLAEKYNEEVPSMLPAHWLPNRWGQDWTALVDVKGIDLDKVMEEKSAEWIVKEGEKFYMSLGFDNLPKTFYEKSSLYPLPEDADYKKNNHASAWHMNLDKDVRSLMSIEPNTEWWETTLHELGHIYYYMTYTNDDVPVILRGGANRGYHEAMGSLMGLASMQKPFLAGLGLIPEDTKVDETQQLLKEALNYIVLIPWGAGVMPEFEYELHGNNLSIDEFNSKWWELKRKYQGIAPPAERGEEYCDAASKTHINNDPAQYYDYAISYILLFQFHDYIAKNILKQDPHATNYYGNNDVGKFLHDVMYPGATVDWREHLKNSIGTEMSAKPMMEYFAPLMEYLKKENEGREHTLPDVI
jgi:peptidyl-dipeptidase A